MQKGIISNHAKGISEHYGRKIEVGERMADG